MLPPGESRLSMRRASYSGWEKMEQTDGRTPDRCITFNTQPAYVSVVMLTFKVLHDNAPRYLGPLVAVADLPGRRALRSASTSRLVIPLIKLSTVASRAFPVAAAQVWNGLPEAVISSSSLQTFRRQLKNSSFLTSIPSHDFWPFDWSL